VGERNSSDVGDDSLSLCNSGEAIVLGSCFVAAEEGKTETGATVEAGTGGTGAGVGPVTETHFEVL
jgi:hypothetical protein